MKPIKTILLIINILFIISVLSLAIFILSYPTWLLLGDKLPFKFEQIQFIYNSNWSVKVLFLVVIFLQILFTIGFYHLKEITQQFVKEKFFSVSIIKHLKKAGITFTTIGLITLILRVLNWIFDSTVMSIWNGIDMIYLFILFIGLFFILISRVLLEMKKIKQENDLTI